ncbi:MAG: MBL fold metallo-hydrolase [Eubacteriales bacterium]|nr:MBL fold metallo-hydrolase [Eubacteriales bacterium]
MRLYFLYHSAVCVVLKKSLLIFDYFINRKGKNLEEGLVSDEDIKNAGSVYVFVSHAHHDHYNRRIYKWAALNDNITYILDSTVPKAHTKGKAVMLSRGESYDDGYLCVQEFGSTDIGGSFYVTCEGTSFFHAGDLNDWHWKDDGNARYSRVMKLYFERELKFIRSAVEHIDYAFFPVDRRIGSDYDEGADMFIDTMKPKYFVPIHFSHFDDTKAFSEKHSAGTTKVFAIHKYGDRLI